MGLHVSIFRNDYWIPKARAKSSRQLKSELEMSKKDETVEETETPATPEAAPEAKVDDVAVSGPTAEAKEEATAEEDGGDKTEDTASKSDDSESSEGEKSDDASSSDETGREEKSERPRRSRSRRSRSRRKPRNGNSRDKDDNDKPSDEGEGDKQKEKLLATPLWGLHKERRAKMVAFAGYDMPVQYKRGIMSEHRQTRDRAGLFDVSHMGQAFLRLEDKGGHEEIAGLIEELVPGNIKGLKPGGVRYTLLLNDEGGIVDDLMVTRPEGEAGDGMLFLVVNAGCKEKDFAYINEKLEGRAKLTVAGDRALIALQGPDASKVLGRHAPFVTDMKFMSAKSCRIDGVECIVSRCGYTGEDGFEISVPNEMAESFTRKLLAHREVALVGLGARDSLRLEAGLCLYGHEINDETTPAEADLMWSISKRRREAKDFPGAEKILTQAEEGVARKRVGIRPQGKAPARDGTDIVDGDGTVIGKVTSGGFGPSVRGPVAMGYVDAAHADDGTEISLMVRGQPRAATVVSLPFITPKQYRPGQVVEAPTEEPTEEAAEEPIEEAVSAEEAEVEAPAEALEVEETESEDAEAEDTGQADAEEQASDDDDAEEDKKD